MQWHKKIEISSEEDFADLVSAPVPDYSLTWLCEELREIPDGVLDRSLFTDLDLRHLAILSRSFALFGDQRYQHWLSMIERVNGVVVEEHGDGAKEEARRLENSVKNAQLTWSVPFEPLFLILTHAKVAEWAKGSLLKVRRDADQFAFDANDYQKARSRHFKALCDICEKMGILSTRVGLRLEEQSSWQKRMADVLREKEPEWAEHALSKEQMSVADLLIFSDLIIEHFMRDAGEYQLSRGRYISDGAPPKATTKPADAMTDDAHLAFEAAISLIKKGRKPKRKKAAPVAFTEELFAQWGIPLTQSKHREWRSSKRGQDTLGFIAGG